MMAVVGVRGENGVCDRVKSYVGRGWWLVSDSGMGGVGSRVVPLWASDGGWFLGLRRGCKTEIGPSLGQLWLWLYGQ